MRNERESLTVQNLRHDIRTPLNQIIGYSELIMEMVDEHQVKALLEPLSLVHRAGNGNVGQITRRNGPLAD